jgi:TetR/AcrR family transcriptional regulator
MAAKDATLAAPLRKLLDEGAATGQFTISDSRDAASAILGAAMIATLTRWEDGRDTQDPEFQQALTDQLVRSVARA